MLAKYDNNTGIYVYNAKYEPGGANVNDFEKDLAAFTKDHPNLMLYNVSLEINGKTARYWGSMSGTDASMYFYTIIFESRQKGM